jgi:cell wall-associated NlpC family hydrolase
MSTQALDPKKWLAFLALVAGVAMCVGMLTASPAEAYPFDRTKVRAYAKKWAANESTLTNSRYGRVASNDCVNFVSQSLVAGGMPMDRVGFDHWSFDTGLHNASDSWKAVLPFRQFMAENTNRAVYQSVPMRDRYTPANRGDVYLYDWGEGNGYSHVSVSTGYGTFYTYPTNCPECFNYNDVTGGRGDKMAQHTRDRDGAPWNWGYWKQRNHDIRERMRTKVIHFTP